MPEQPTGIVEFGRDEIDPVKAKDYSEKIRKAREELPHMSARDRLANLKKHTPVGGPVPRPPMPDLALAAATPAHGSSVGDELRSGVSPRPSGSPAITQKTAQQLADMVEAAKADPHSVPVQPLKVEPARLEEDDLLDALDLGAMRNEADRIHANRERRKAIEGRCQPMAFDDLLWKGEVRQNVPIIPGVFEVIFKSITGDESLFIRRYVARLNRVSDAHDLTIYSMCQLVCAVASITGRTQRVFEDMRNKDGQVDDKLFEQKLKTLSGMALPILADLSVNHDWFDLRVRRLINPEDLKNG